MATDTIYDHPLYYEILFGWDRSREADFYHHTFRRCGVPDGARVLEVACGTGGVARLLAARGWRVTGLDVRPAMVAFARERGLDAVCADMTRFSIAAKLDAAYNPLSSFRLLHDDASADAHLARIAAALRPGGVYAIDMDFVARADEAAITTDESWEMTQGSVSVRAENDAVYVNDGSVERVLAWGDEEHLRTYTPSAFAARVWATPALALESWHPEVSRATGVTEFALDPAPTPPARGRCMVVLRRR